MKFNVARFRFPISINWDQAVIFVNRLLDCNTKNLKPVYIHVLDMWIIEQKSHIDVGFRILK